MMRAARPPTNKRRKLCETNRWLPSIKEESRGSSCGNGKDMGKVQVDYYQEAGSMLHITPFCMKKYLGDIHEAHYASHRNYIQRGSRQASSRCSPLMEKNLVELLPSCKFHNVRKRSFHHYKKGPRRNGSSINLDNDQRSKVDSSADIAAHTETVQTECSPSMYQISGRRFGTVKLPTVCKIERKHADKLMCNLKLQIPVFDEGCLEAEKKITKAYARKKSQEQCLNGKSKVDSFKDLTNDHGSKVDPDCGRGTITEFAQTDCSTPISQKFGKRFAGIEPSMVNRVKRKHADNQKHRFELRFPLLEEGCLKAGRKITKAYKRKKLQQPPFKDGSPDLYALHILADAALSLEQEPIFHVNGKKGRQTFMQVHHECETLSAKCENDAYDICGKRVAEQASVAEAFSVIHNDLPLGQLSIKGSVSGKRQASASMNDEHTSNSTDELIDCWPLISSQTLVSAKFRSQAFIVYDANDSTCTPKLPIQEFNFKYAAGLSCARTKVSCAWGQLEPCSSHQENSKPKRFRLMEKQSRLEELPCSLNNNDLVDESSGSRVIGIVQSSQQKAASLVKVSINQVEDGSKVIGMQHSSYRQNGGSRYHHQGLSCKYGEAAETVHSIYSKDQLSSVANCGIPSKLISACVAALFMIQACSDTRLPPAEAMEILELATRNLHPRCSQNLPIYREIEELMCVIKTQILALVHAPSTNLQA